MKQIVVNKEDLRHNINKIKEFAKNNSDGNEYTIIGVVKGNGYGLDLIQYSQFLVDNGIEYLAVATMEEALKLSKANISKKILLLTPINEKEDVEEAIKNDITLTVDSTENVEIINELSKKGYNIKVHIKVDTGFGRYGFIYNNFESILENIKKMQLNNVKIEGIYSHLSNAYYRNDKHTKQQYNNFKAVLDYLEKNNVKIKMRHICNSPAFLNYPDLHLNTARIGSAFLGRVCAENNIGLKKIATMEIDISEIKKVPKNFNISYSNSFKTKRETTIAILPVGYLDGYNVGKKTDMFRPLDRLRRAFNEIKLILKKEKMTAIINEKRYNIIGTIRNVSHNSRCYRWTSKTR